MSFMIRRVVITLFATAFVSLFLTGAYRFGISLAHADAGSAVSAAAPADQLHDPASDPGAAFDDLKAARKVGWSAAVFAGLVIAGRLLGKAKSVPWLAWLGKGRTAIAVGAIGATAAGCYNVAASGGSWTAILMAGAVAVAAWWHPDPPAPQPPVASTDNAGATAKV